MQEFKGKVAVVTGAASGMGRGLAERFAREGMKVVLADVEEPALNTAVEELQRQGFEVIGQLADVSQLAQVEALRYRTLEQYGKVHILCNNAGVVSHGATAIWDSSMRDWEWVLGVNLWGVIHGMSTFLPIMIEQDEAGHVVNKDRHGAERQAEVEAKSKAVFLRHQSGGMAPSEVADHVFNAIKVEQFYLITEPNPASLVRIKENVRVRMESILAERNLPLETTPK